MKASFHLRKNPPFQVDHLPLKLLILLLQRLVTLDPGLCVHQSGPMPLYPPLHRPHQLPSGSRRNLTPLEALLPRHQGRVRRPHPIKHVPKAKRISTIFPTKDAYCSYLGKDIKLVV